MTAADAAGWLTLGIWLYLALGRGWFWRVRDAKAEGALPVPAPRVTAVIPARNEADVIARAVASLVSQKYPGEFHIVVVDDASEDGTAAAAEAVGASRVTVIRAAPLPAGWTGKLWAVSEGIRAAQRFRPDYLLLCDADIEHPAGNVAALAARAAAGPYDLVSYMATLHCESFAERALIPAFVFFFFLLYPPRWIRDRRRRTAGAAGGCMLVRRAALERAGGVEAIRGELIDDCALASAIRSGGGRVWLGPSSGTRSLRAYAEFGAIGAMISRSAFTQLRHSWLLLGGTVAGMAVAYLLPPVLALGGSMAAMAAWALMTAVFLPVLKFYRLSPLWAPFLPLTAAFYLAATVHSAVAYRRGKGGRWKGRVQDAR